MPSASDEKIVLLLAAMALAARLAGCSNQGPCEKPGEVIEAFYAGVEAGDLESAWKLLDKDSRTALEKISQETKAKTGQAFPPHELIVPGLTERKGEIKKIEPRKEKGGRMETVVVQFEDGTSAIVPMAREGNCFKVHLGI
jgi:hypothetical protein